MMIRRAFLKLAFLSLAGLCICSAALVTTPARADAAAEKFVTDISQKAIGLLSNRSLSKPQLESQFGQLLNDNAAMDKIAVFALGQFKKLPNDTQRAEYLTLFKQFVTKIYVTRLSDYQDEKLVVTGSGPAKGGAIVKSQINFTNGRQPLEITWWLFNEGVQFKVFDMNVQGIWLAQEQRSAFLSVINNNGGNFEALLTHLRKQIASSAPAAQ